MPNNKNTDKSGIYQIRNLITNHLYIGRTKDFSSRWDQHTHSLNKNKHHNVFLQEAWNEYGEENFSFEVIHLCDEESLVLMEKTYFILKPEYNFPQYITQNRRRVVPDALFRLTPDMNYEGIHYRDADSIFFVDLKNVHEVGLNKMEIEAAIKYKSLYANRYWYKI